MRASGCAQWDLETFLALAAPEDELAGCARTELKDLLLFATALPALVDLQGQGLAYLAGTKTLSRLEAFGRRGPERKLLGLVDEWRLRGRPKIERLRIEVSYGAGRRSAWRTKRRPGSTIFFDWD